MKKNLIFALLALLFVQCDHKDIVTQDKSRLPQQAQDFIATYFPTEEVSYITIDKEMVNTTYEVKFVGGTELSFDKNGEWSEVDCQRAAVPEGIIPTAIANYVRQNFSNEIITQIEKDKRQYEVHLSNGLELYFNRQGEYIGADS